MRGFALPLFSHILSYKKRSLHLLFLCFLCVWQEEKFYSFPVFLHLSCTTSHSPKSNEMGVSDPPFRVYEKMKQGSATIFMVTAVVNREVPDIFSGFLLKGGRVPGNPPSKNQFSQKCLFFSDFIGDFQLFSFRKPPVSLVSPHNQLIIGSKNSKTTGATQNCRILPRTESATVDVYRYHLFNEK